MEIRPGNPLAVGITDKAVRDPLTGQRVLVIVENPNPDQPDQPMGGGLRIVVPLDDAQIRLLHEQTSPVDIAVANKLPTRSGDKLH